MKENLPLQMQLVLHSTETSCARVRVRDAPAVAERVEHVIAGAVQRQAIAGVEQAPHRRRALEMNHLLDVQLHLSRN